MDTVFALLEITKFEKSTWRMAWKRLERKSLDELIYVMNDTTTGDQFRHQIKLSVAYRDYTAPPEISAIWQWEAMLAKELRNQIDKANYESVQQSLDNVNITDRDDVSLALVSQLSDKNLLTIAKTEEGNAFLTRLYDELSSGKYEADEKHQAERIFKAKNGVFATNKADLEEGFIRHDIKTFPRRKTGITVGLTAPAAKISARRIRPGYIWVELNPGVYASAAYRKEVESLGNESFWKGGIEIPEDEIVKVIDYDEGGTELYCPAFHLLQISNEDTTHTFEKIGEVAGYALMFGPSAAAEGGIEAVTFAAKAAKFLRFADRIAGVFGVITSVLIEHRGWLIKQFGKPFVETIERINSAIMVYGFVRMATQMPRLVAGLKTSHQAWRKAVHEREMNLRLSEEQERAIRSLDDSTEALNKAIQDTRAANDNIEVPGEATNSPLKSTQPPSPSNATDVSNVRSMVGRPSLGPDEGLAPGPREVTNLSEFKARNAPPQRPPTEPAAQAVPLVATEEIEGFQSLAKEQRLQQGMRKAAGAELQSTDPTMAIGGQGKTKPMSPGVKPAQVETPQVSEGMQDVTDTKIAEPPKSTEGRQAFETSKVSEQLAEVAPKTTEPEAFGIEDPLERAQSSLERNQERIRELEKKQREKTRAARRNPEKIESEIHNLKKENELLREDINSLTPAKGDEPLVDLERRWFRQREGESLDAYRKRMTTRKEIVEDEATRAGGRREVWDRYDELMRSLEERSAKLEKAVAERATAELDYERVKREWISRKESARRRKVGFPGKEDLDLEQAVKNTKEKLELAETEIRRAQFGISNTGELAEKSIARDYLLESGEYRNIRSIQNPSGHGIDLVAERVSDGKEIFFEVKGSETSKVKGPSKRQKDITSFVTESLENSASPDAKNLLKRIQPGDVEGFVIQIKDINLLTGKGKLKLRPW